MNWLKSLFKPFLLLGLLVSVSAHAATEGQEYMRLSPPQPTDTGPRKVEVLEVFSYACPHCAHLAPLIEPWAKKLPPQVVFKRIPVSFGRDQWAIMARTYYTLEALHLTDRLHTGIFQAIHEQRIDLFSEDTLFSWMEKQGVDRKKFISTFNSFAVQSEVQRGDQRAMALGIDSVPTIFVDGRFVTSPSMAGGNEAVIPVLDALVRQAMKDKGL